MPPAEVKRRRDEHSMNGVWLIRRGGIDELVEPMLREREIIGS